MKKTMIIIFIALITSITITGCKSKYEFIEVSGKSYLSNKAANIRINKEWTFNYYTIDENDEELTVTLYYKPYKEDK